MADLLTRPITRPLTLPLAQPVEGTWRSGGGGQSFDPDAAALFARMSVQPDATRKTLINDLIVGLKDDAIWSEADAFFMLSAADSQAALLDWKRSSVSGIAVNSPTFEVDRGYTGDGAASRIRTNYTPLVDGVKYTQNDASLWVWCRTAVTAAVIDVGSLTAPRTFIQSNNSGVSGAGTINDGGSTAFSGAGTSIGLTGIQRSTSTERRMFKNGAQVASDVAITSTGLPAQEQWICGGNSTHFSTRQIAFAMWASSLAGKEAALYNRLNTYMQAIGAA